MSYVGVAPIPNASQKTHETVLSEEAQVIAIPGGYTPGAIKLYVDGLLRLPSSYTASDGLEIDLGSSHPEGTEILLEELSSFNLAVVDADTVDGKHADELATAEQGDKADAAHAGLEDKLNKDGGLATKLRYDLAVASTIDTLDLAATNVFHVDASVERTLVFANEHGADHSMPVVVHITGNAKVNWPTGIDWDGDSAPSLGDNKTKVILFWDGVEWSGAVRVAK